MIQNGKMGFKFTFLGFEFSRNKEHLVRKEESKMSHHKLTRQQKKFGKCVRKAHFNTYHPSSFGRFMSKCLKGRR